MMRSITLAACLALVPLGAATAQTPRTFTHADTLRGSNTPQRAWWDVTFYDLHVQVTPSDSSIRGFNGITYRVLHPAQEMQIDLQVPLEVDSIIQDGRALTFRRDGNAFFVTLTAPQPAGAQKTVTVYYHGKPRVAKRPPWDGGFIWAQDSLGHLWVATACQGIGASVWWPNKDLEADEPDSQRIAITVPDPMIDVSNGRLRRTIHHGDGTTTYEWFVDDPINNYDVAINAGTYAHFSETYAGEAGPLTLDFWPLAYHLDTAKVQFQQAKSMLKCFEGWFGPYPWYRDGYKLVEAPHLGMEHQSAVAYGNHFQNGYRGRDLSGTGYGAKWDFIIVHESAHEWFGNNITYRDIADMWVHESFANYAEGLYTECLFGKRAGAAYIIGSRRNVRNDGPIVGHYGVHDEGSGDMYYKGGNMLHTIRQIVGDDAKWRSILRGLNTAFRHQTVTGRQVQAYISRQTGIDLSKVFEQYLTTTQIPVLEYKITGDTLAYRWANVVPGFDMPVRVSLGGRSTLLHPTESWQTMTVSSDGSADLRVDENFYVESRNVAAGAASPAPPSDRPWPPVATFSILGYDPETGEIGAAVQSRVFSVGNGVLWGEADVGVVATQAIVDVSYGRQALELLRKGMTPAQVVTTVWTNDPDPEPERWSKYGRQFAVMNARGEVAAYTGPKAPAWAGDKQGEHCSAQGNILAGPEVVDAMVKAFEDTKGQHLSFRLLAALEAGQQAGGDKRGMQSAAMLIVKKDGGVWLHNDTVLRLQVDDSPEPIKELRRLVEKAAEQRARLTRGQDDHHD